VTTDTTDASGVTIWYETFGSRSHPSVLLIAGRGAQAISWPQAFCTRLMENDRFVIRYDSRDVGLSQWFPEDADAYTLEDMVGDAVAIIDALGLARVHVVGTSMGGMVAQLFASMHPDRTATLTSIMASPGGPNLARPSPEAVAAMTQAATGNGTRQARIEAALELRRVLAGGGFPADDTFRREQVEHALDRADHPTGAMNHSRAIAAAQPRAALLAKVSVPVLVLHGTADPLVPIANGEATAQAAPHARFVPIEGMGHELPPTVWPVVVAEITTHTS
jgi:pimeloyl-ACP methyl ester carboxylesterase